MQALSVHGCGEAVKLVKTIIVGGELKVKCGYCHRWATRAVVDRRDVKVGKRKVATYKVVSEMVCSQHQPGMKP